MLNTTLIRLKSLEYETVTGLYLSQRVPCTIRAVSVYVSVIEWTLSSPARWVGGVALQQGTYTRIIINKYCSAAAMVS